MEPKIIYLVHQGRACQNGFLIKEDLNSILETGIPTINEEVIDRLQTGYSMAGVQTTEAFEKYYQEKGLGNIDKYVRSDKRLSSNGYVPAKTEIEKALWSIFDALEAGENCLAVTDDRVLGKMFPNKQLHPLSVVKIITNGARTFSYSILNS